MLCTASCLFANHPQLWDDLSWFVDFARRCTQLSNSAERSRGRTPGCTWCVELDKIQMSCPFFPKRIRFDQTFSLRSEDYCIPFLEKNTTVIPIRSEIWRAFPNSRPLHPAELVLKWWILPSIVFKCNFCMYARIYIYYNMYHIWYQRMGKEGIFFTLLGSRPAAPSKICQTLFFPGHVVLDVPKHSVLQHSCTSANKNSLWWFLQWEMYR